MGRETYTFTLNFEALQNIFNSEDNIHSLVKYVEEVANPEIIKEYNAIKIPHTLYNAYEIISNIKESPDKCTAADIGIVYFWLLRSKLSGHDGWLINDWLEALKQYGFDCIHEFTTKLDCKQYMEGMGDYTFRSKTEEEVSFYENTHVMESILFNNYLDYIRLLFCKAFFEQDDGNTDDGKTLTGIEKASWDFIYHRIEKMKEFVKQHAPNVALNELVDAELAYKRAYNDYEEHIANAEFMFDALTTIKSQLTNYNGKIFIYDSF